MIAMLEVANRFGYSLEVVEVAEEDTVGKLAAGEVGRLDRMYRLTYDVGIYE